MLCTTAIEAGLTNMVYREISSGKLWLNGFENQENEIREKMAQLCENLSG